MKKLNNLFTALGVASVEQDKRDLEALKVYCQEDGYEEDYYNIILPIYEKYGFDLFNRAMLKWGNCSLNLNEKPYVEYLDLDALSCCVYWDDSRGKFVAY